ncbi:MAG: hypothetical protein ACTSWQ_06850 [Candidatus Thorarchaeota archaeon]
MPYNEYFNYSNCSVQQIYKDSLNYKNGYGNYRPYSRHYDYARFTGCAHGDYTDYRNYNNYTNYCAVYNEYVDHIDYVNPDSGLSLDLDWSDWPVEGLSGSYFKESVVSLKALRDNVHRLSTEKSQQDVVTNVASDSLQVGDPTFLEASKVKAEQVEAIRWSLQELLDEMPVVDPIEMTEQLEGGFPIGPPFEDIKDNAENLAGTTISGYLNVVDEGHKENL